MDTFRLLLELCAPRRGLRVREPVFFDGDGPIAAPQIAAPQIAAPLPDPDALVTLARNHRVSTHLFRALSASPELRLLFCPERAFGRLKRDCRAGNAFRDFAFREWLRIDAALRERGLQAVNFKGPSLAFQLYGDPLARENRDLDVLSAGSDLRAFIPVMEGLGYGVKDFDGELENRAPGVQFRVSHHLVMEHPAMGLSVEIHNRLSKLQSRLPAPDAALLLSRAVRCNWNGSEWDTLDPVDHGLYMISHGAGHAWCLLHWLLDLAVFLSRDDGYDWAEFLRRARELRLERTICLALALCHRFFEFGTPAVLEPIESLWDKRLERALAYALKYLPPGSQREGDYACLFGLRFAFLSALDDRSHPVRDTVSEFALVGYVQSRAWGLPRFLAPLYWPVKFCLVLRKAAYRAITGTPYPKKNEGPER